MKPFFKWLLKAFVSGILACVILTLFCVFYYNLPVHSSTADGATDYSWEKINFILVELRALLGAEPITKAI